MLAVAATPEQGKLLRVSQIEKALRAAGRQRNLRSKAEQISAALRTEQLTAQPLVTLAYGATVRSAVAVLTALTQQIELLGEQVEASFGQHPDAQIILSQPGLGPILGARVLAEFGDDPDRYADAKARKNYSGMSPITRSSGTRRVVLARYARNQRLSDALYLQAFSALSSSPGARGYYDTHRARGATHHQALRSLGNRLVGILHGCLRHKTTYREDTAWPNMINREQAAAA